MENGSTENESLERRLEAIGQLVKFSFGSLWTVGENLWKRMLVPKGYDAKSTRDGHPGICVRETSHDVGLHSTVQMWYGTSNMKNPAYKIENFYNSTKEKEKEHVTYFGHFQAVPIPISALGSERKRGKNQFARNLGRPMLTDEEKVCLRTFIRKNFSLVGA